MLQSGLIFIIVKAAALLQLRIPTGTQKWHTLCNDMNCHPHPIPILAVVESRPASRQRLLASTTPSTGPNLCPIYWAFLSISWQYHLLVVTQESCILIALRMHRHLALLSTILYENIQLDTKIHLTKSQYYICQWNFLKSYWVPYIVSTIVHFEL